MKNITLISASAGSGKTHELSTRLAHLIKNGIPADSIIATTFTKKAAAELRDRVRMEVLKTGGARDREALIGTVNSICGRFLTEYAIDAGLSPALEVLPGQEDGEDNRVFRSAIVRQLARHGEYLTPIAQRLSLDGRGTSRSKQPDWQDEVKKVVKLARANGIDEHQLRAYGQQSWKDMKNLLPAASNVDLRDSLNEAVLEAIERMETRPGDVGTLKALATLREWRDTIARGENPAWERWHKLKTLKPVFDAKADADEVKRIAETLLSQPAFHKDLQRMIEGVFDCAADSLREYDEYKREHGLIDYVDQESKLLALALGNDSYRRSMQERITRILVDEFQDTSPIQLALFTALHDSIDGESTWVGDPKQAIYGFRGSDAQLMHEVTSRLVVDKVLGDSWRSRENLVDFTNAVFTRTFHAMKEEEIRLAIPILRRDEALGGWMQVWRLDTDTKDTRVAAVANGIADLLNASAAVPGVGEQPLQPGDIAILCWANETSRAIAAALEQRGIRASAPRDALMQTHECLLALSALRFMQDDRDTLALAQIVHLSPLHPAHGAWLADLVRTPQETLEGWRTHPIITALDAARDRLIDATPLEALEAAMDAVSLHRTVTLLGDTSRRLANLDELRAECRRYLDECRARRAAATVRGFITHTGSSDSKQASGAQDEAVHVGTYHSAKGLEWPVVVLTDLDRVKETSVFGPQVVAASPFQIERPLEGRSVRYWPRPFIGRQKVDGFDDMAVNEPHARKTAALEREEKRRLLYVAMTRARDGLVLCLPAEKKDGTVKTGWLDMLQDHTGKPILDWADCPDAGSFEMRIDDERFDFTVRTFDDGDRQPTTGREEVWLPEDVPMAQRAIPAATLSPSRLGDDAQAPDGVDAAEVHASVPLEIRDPRVDRTALGEAVHAYMAVDLATATQERRMEIAARLLERWGVDGAVDPDDLVETGRAFDAFLAARYPGAAVHREWPVLLRTEGHQMLSGRIDALLDTADGFVVVDHKSEFGTDALHTVISHAPQLAAYAHAVTVASQRPVHACLIHLPFAGKVIELSGVAAALPVELGGHG